MDRTAVLAHQRESAWWLRWAVLGLVVWLWGMVLTTQARPVTMWVEGPACHFEGYANDVVVPVSVVTEEERRAAGCPSDIDGDPSE